MNRPVDNEFREQQILQSINSLNNQQHDQVDDDNLFIDHKIKCRCCLKKISDISGKNILHSWHRDAFKELTGVAMSLDKDFGYLMCLNCIEILKMSKIFIELGDAAENMKNAQNRYEKYVQNLKNVVVKQEVVEPPGPENQSEQPSSTAAANNNDQEIHDDNDASYRPDPYSDDEEELSGDEMAADREQASFDELVNNNNLVLANEVAAAQESNVEMMECSVRVERLDTATLKKYSRTRKNARSNHDGIAIARASKFPPTMVSFHVI